MKRWVAILEKLADRRGAATALVVLLASVVVLLAVLQYRWIGQVAEAERNRIRTGMDRALARCAAEFNIRVGAAVQSALAAAFSSADLADGIARRVWIAHRQPDGEATLHLASSGGDFAAVPWPDGFDAARAMLEGPQMRRGPGAMILTPGGRLLAVTPVPLSGGPPRMGGPSRWAVVELDRQVLLDEILPELVSRHFSVEYYVAVSEGGRTIFSTAGDPPSAAPPDAVAELLALAGPGPGFPRRGPFGPPAMRLRGIWELQVWPSAGALEEVVESTRRRNLAASLASLAVMAVTLGMLVLSARRARKLAALQVDFVAGVSHEMRTPLAVIESAAENVADGVIVEPHRLRQYGELIRDESRRLSGTVEQVLAFAGAQAGRLRYDVRPVSIEKAIEEALAGASSNLTRAGAKVKVSLEAGIPPVQADQRFLTLAIRNLVANAAKHGGDLIVITAHRDGHDVVIGVQDNGPGIPPAELPHVFEPFYRGGAARDRQLQGTGLGLSLVKRIVEGQGGGVEASSEPGKGACFRLRLTQSDTY